MNSTHKPIDSAGSDTSWSIRETPKERKILQKSLAEAARALEESKKSNQPIVGFRPKMHCNKVDAAKQLEKARKTALEMARVAKNEVGKLLLDDYRRENKILRDALTFYAEGNHFRKKFSATGGKIVEDHGETARAALDA